MLRGVVGNSGVAGATLCRAPTCPSHYRDGVFCDADGTLWAGGPVGYVYRYDADGKVRAQHLIGKGWSLWSKLAGDRRFLYLLAVRPGQTRLFRLDRTAAPPGPGAQEIAIEGVRLDGSCTLAGNLDRRGHLTLAPNRPNPPQRVLKVDPATGRVRVFAQGPWRQNHYVELDRDDNVYLGVWDRGVRVIKFDASGQPVRGTNWPMRGLERMTIPGGDVLYFPLFNGILTRYALDGRNAPGRVRAFDYDMLVSAQAVRRPDGTLVFTRWPDRGLLVCHETDDEVLAVKRFGGFGAKGLAVGRDGFVRVGHAAEYYGAFPPDAQPDTPLRRTTVLPVWMGGSDIGGAAADGDDTYIVCNDRRRPTRGVTHLTVTLNHSQGFQAVPPKDGFLDAQGLAVFRYPNAPAGHLFVADTGHHCVKRFPLFKHEDKTSVPERVSFSPAETRSPKGIAFDAGGNLYLSDTVGVHKFAFVGPRRYRPVWSVPNGHGPACMKEPWGVAVDGLRVYVVDRAHHCLRALSIVDGRLVDTFGQPGVTGDDLGHLRNPTFVAARDRTVYVADTGNHRIVRLLDERPRHKRR